MGFWNFGKATSSNQFWSPVYSCFLCSFDCDWKWDNLRSLMEIILEVMRFFLVCHQWEPLPSWSNPSYGSLKLAFGEMEPETPGVISWLEGNLGSVESGGAECSGVSVTSHVIKYPAGSNFGVQRVLFAFCLALAYSLRDYSSLWQGRYKSKSVRQLSHCICSQDAKGWVLVPTGFLLVLSPGPHPSGWCHPHAGWSSPLS